MALLLIAGNCCLAQPHFTERSISLDVLDLTKISQATGRPQATDNRANLVVNGQHFSEGFSTRSESELVIALDGKGSVFSAETGIDDRATAFRPDTVLRQHSWAIFSVIGDGRLLWSGGKQFYGHDAQRCQVSIQGIRRLSLRVTGGPGNTHADWLNTRLRFLGKTPYTDWPVAERQQIKKNETWLKMQAKRFPQPRINGADRIGIRPGTPIIYPLAVSGRGLLSIYIAGLPKGLHYDRFNKIIRGTMRNEGHYRFLIVVKNTAGIARRNLEIVVGDSLALTPPMGYLSWNVTEGLVNEVFMRESAAAFRHLGFIAAGYQYLNLDDCWQGKRDAASRLQPDQQRFPQGLQLLAADFHRQGLKLGIYSSPGATTCAGYPGTLNFEEVDVKTWTKWGIDYLKYDPCSVPADQSGELFKRMGSLLQYSGRSIVYCGRNDGTAQLWRIGGDLRD